MRKTNLVLTVIILIVISLTACNNNSTQPTKPVVKQDYIMPLAVGNIWVMSIKELRPDSTIYRSSIDTIRILSDTIINGIKWYIPIWSGLYLRNNEWGLNTYESESGIEAKSYKYPAEINFSWITDTLTWGSNNYPFTYDTLIYGYRIDRIDTLVTVPAGTFNCYHYRNFTRTFAGVETDTWKQVGGEYWFSPGYGWIKGINYDMGSGFQVTELIHLDLK